MKSGSALVALIAAAALAGCGLQVSSPDLLQVTRTGQGQPLTLVVNDGGTIRCNGGAAKPLRNSLLLKARDLDRQLTSDAKASLRLRTAPGTVFSYTARIQSGTISFSDRSAVGRPELAQLQLFVLQAAREACGLTA
jgi:hypothetical protein